MEPTYRGLGRCSCAFWLAVSFDIFGLLVLLIGVFADIFFYDFLIYAGAIIIFLSLVWWVFWYTGNIEVPPEELEDDVGLLKKKRGIAGAVRRLSSRLTNSVRNSLRRNGGPPRGVARRAGTGQSTTHMRDAQQQPKRPPVVLTMGPLDEDMHTVSASVDTDIPVPHTATETSAI
ncbi:transmembrane protein 238 [Oncorhynchus keta]|uniref:transmembrane protein 238 n=1 Tax=Oncorhynchus keta TaxID=8018 RepID=UPI0015FC4D2A|nr:transmembrane protein 238 [Oncorhynchus keta]XP_052347551.1 transmembrane protein 238 [Oncorhynchus keta]